MVRNRHSPAAEREEVVDGDVFRLAAGLTLTLGVAAACWVVALRQMNGMDMGVASRLGSFAFFIGVWVAMMAAMMLPGAGPAVVTRVRESRRLHTAPMFLVSYLAIWTLFGVVVYEIDRPHGTAVAGVVAIAAGVYELTPLKRRCRERCQDGVRSGLGFGVCCVGSSVGLMALLVAVGVMSVTWMVVIGAVVVAQKLVRPRAGIDVLLAMALIGLGVAILVAPDSIPGLMPSM